MRISFSLTITLTHQGWWLAERQVECGGLNGRPEKKEDVSVNDGIVVSYRC